jgi:hypothetical protein
MAVHQYQHVQQIQYLSFLPKGFKSANWLHMILSNAQRSNATGFEDSKSHTQTLWIFKSRNVASNVPGPLNVFIQQSSLIGSHAFTA